MIQTWLKARTVELGDGPADDVALGLPGLEGVALPIVGEGVEDEDDGDDELVPAPGPQAPTMASAATSVASRSGPRCLRCPPISASCRLRRASRRCRG